MSVVADVRKLLQDLVAPELDAIKLRLDHIEKQLAENERRAEGRHEEMLAKIRVTVDYAIVLERLTRIEEKQDRKELT